MYLDEHLALSHVLLLEKRGGMIKGLFTYTVVKGNQLAERGTVKNSDGVL